MNKKAMTPTEIIRSVADGDKRELVLSEVNEQAFRSRAYDANIADGWEHYKIATNKAMNILMVIVNKPTAKDLERNIDKMIKDW